MIFLPSFETFPNYFLYSFFIYRCLYYNSFPLIVQYIFLIFIFFVKILQKTLLFFSLINSHNGNVSILICKRGQPSGPFMTFELPSKFRIFSFPHLKNVRKPCFFHDLNSLGHISHHKTGMGIRCHNDRHFIFFTQIQNDQIIFPGVCPGI